MTKSNETDTKELLEIHSTLLKEHFRDIEDLEDRVKNIEETFKDIFGREEDESKETKSEGDHEEDLEDDDYSIRTDDEVVDIILKNVDIVKVIGDFVELYSEGKCYIGLCPFHKEKTPSFKVDPVKQVFHCFGCGTSGNALSFLLGMKLTFNQALTYLMGARKSYNASVKNDK